MTLFLAVAVPAAITLVGLFLRRTVWWRAFRGVNPPAGAGRTRSAPQPEKGGGPGVLPGRPFAGRNARTFCDHKPGGGCRPEVLISFPVESTEARAIRAAKSRFLAWLLDFALEQFERLLFFQLTFLRGVSRPERSRHFSTTRMTVLAESTPGRTR